MRTINESRELAIAKIVLVEVMRIAKLNNPTSVMGISEEDISYMAKNIANDYLSQNLEAGKKILDAAVTQLHALAQRESKVTLGDFNRLCYAGARQAAEQAKTEALIAPKANLSPKGVAKENINLIKEMIGKTMKALPYNQNIRVTRQKDGTAPIEEIEEPWKPTIYSDGPRLYEQCVRVGAIAPIESIQNIELKSLYKKAWTVGITPEEKERFSTLQQEHR